MGAEELVAATTKLLQRIGAFEPVEVPDAPAPVGEVEVSLRLRGYQPNPVSFSRQPLSSATRVAGSRSDVPTSLPDSGAGLALSADASAGAPSTCAAAAAPLVGA